MSLILLPGLYLSLMPESVHGIRFNELAGGYIRSEQPDYYPDLLFSGEYSAEMQTWIRENYPYRGWFIRLHNQLDYSLFRHSSNERIAVGQKGELYDVSYIQAWQGKDAMHPDTVSRFIEAISNLRDSLKAYQTELLVLTPPGKPSFMPRYLPNRILSEVPSTSNRQRVSHALEEAEVPFIDFEYFNTVQEKEPHRLYPRSGLHWSLYGAAVAADTLRNRISELLQTELPQISWTTQPYYDRMQTDFEVERAMNLLWPIDQREMVRPVYRFDESAETFKPKVIIIGDSYYKVWYDQGIQEKLFHPESQFWYYGRAILPAREINGEPVIAPALNVSEEVRKADLVLFVNAEINLPRLGFGLIERMAGK